MELKNGLFNMEKIKKLVLFMGKSHIFPAIMFK